MSEQTDNPVNPDAENIFDQEESGSGITDFMAELDKQVSPAGRTSSSDQETSDETSPDEETSSAASPDTQEDIDYKQRYADSTREFQRLQEEKKQLEKQLNALDPVMPIVDALKQDQRLVQHVRNYFEQGGDTPASLKEELALPDDFVFDPDAAIREPNSAHAQVLNTLVERRARNIVEDKLGQYEQKQQQQIQKQQQQQQLQQFMHQQDLDPDTQSDFKDFLANHEMTFEDAYRLYQGQKRDKNIVKDTQQKTKEQLQKTTKQSKSLASKNSAPTGEKSPDDALMEAIMGIDSKAENIFGSN